MKNCLVCNSDIDEIVSFGKMPIANGFLRQDQFSTEYFFDLRVGFCPSCTMVQLMEQPDREKMFNENYAFFSSTSRLMGEHFKDFADTIINKYLNNSSPFVVEMGSNDGIMLQWFKSRGINHLGIEPSANVAAVAQEKGINTVSKFFDENLAKEIVGQYGQADAFLSANCMCHIPYIHSIAAGIKLLLKPQGVLAFEDPYMGDVVETTAYDQFYDEHVFLFTVASIQNVFSQHGMEVFDVEHQETHGGSMRYYIGHKGQHQISQNVVSQIAKEQKLGLYRIETYQEFRRDCEKSKDDLIALLNTVKVKGAKIVGYAATSKSTTIINYCGITTEHIDYISDTTPIKQGKFSPGAHIPVRSYDTFCNNYPEYSLLFAYNHAKEIMAKEQRFMQAGGKWIVYVPEVKVL
jgi:methylation protein EvaC